MRVLGIETSCDETGIAIYDQYRGILFNQVYSQYALHKYYGGVVPELAARDHICKIIPLIISALESTHLKSKDMHGIAYTSGPGLVGSLLVGATIGRTLAYAWKIPAIDINHMEAHLLAPMLEEIIPDFPLIALLVSGGHTQLVLANKIGEYKILGSSLDDAAGEVFDKIATLLGLTYPGGALLSKMAENGIPGHYIFPRPMINQPNLNFSFSGLKTCVANTIMFSDHNKQTYANIAYEFEKAIVDTLVIKCSRALNQTGIKNLIVSGGVSANRKLRLRFLRLMDTLQGKVFYPRLDFCTDNGAMVAYTGYLKLQSGLISKDLSILVRPRWSLEEISR